MFDINIETTFKCALIAWWLSEFAPLQDLLKWVGETFLNDGYLKSGLSCFTCLAFWTTLFITLNPIQAILASLLASVYSKFMSSIKTRL